MKSGNPVPGSNSHDEDARSDADCAACASGQQVRDIQEIIAKLESVTELLAHRPRTLPQPRDPDQEFSS